MVDNTGRLLVIILVLCAGTVGYAINAALARSAARASRKVLERPRDLLISFATGLAASDVTRLASAQLTYAPYSSVKHFPPIALHVKIRLGCFMQ